MKTYLEPQKSIDVFCEADVIIVGGGPAGIAAALASARTGAKTVLIERFGCLGGLQTQCFQMCFAFCDPGIQGGIIREVLARLEDAGATPRLADLPAPVESGLFQSLIASVRGKDKVPKRMFERAGYWWQWGRQFDSEYYKLMLDRMMAEAGVRLLYHTLAAGAIREGDVLKGVIIESKEGRKALMGKVVIDTSGEGDIAWKSGAPVFGGDPIPFGRYQGTYHGMVNAFYIGGVDLEKFDRFRKENPAEWNIPVCGRETVQQGMKEGYHLRDGGIILFPREGNKIWLMFPVYPVREGRCWEIDQLTKGEIELREQMWGLWKLMKDKVPGFEKSFIEKTPVMPLCGDTHRIVGDYVLTVGDMRDGRVFDDAVGISNMIPDLYAILGKLSFDILPHDVPYRCLVSSQIDNLMAAGTTMSSGMLAMTGLRYCVPSFIQGQAAGTAAAMAVKNGVVPKKVNIAGLQETLRSQGALVSVKEVSDEVLEPYRAMKELSLMAGKPELYDEVAKY